MYVFRAVHDLFRDSHSSANPSQLCRTTALRRCTMPVGFLSSQEHNPHFFADCLCDLFWQLIASAVAMASSTSIRARSAGTAVISLLFSSTTTSPSVIFCCKRAYDMICFVLAVSSSADGFSIDCHNISLFAFHIQPIDMPKALPAPTVQIFMMSSSLCRMFPLLTRRGSVFFVILSFKLFSSITIFYRLK